jgi:hypothetical protein
VAFLSLLQFPFAAPIYFCYVAPLVGLAVEFIWSSQPFAPRRVQLCTLAFCLFFAVVFLNRLSLFDHPRTYLGDPAINELTLPRAGLLVNRRDKFKYEALVSLVQAHSPPGSPIFAAPDCPEVYFLSERKNPTRTMFELFDTRGQHSKRCMELIKRHGIDVVVLNLQPSHSKDVEPDLVEAVREDFTHVVTIDNFMVAYRDNE